MKLFIIMVLLFVTLYLSGCSSVQAATVRNEDGTIDEIVRIAIDPEEIQKSGYLVEAVQSDITAICLREANRIIDEYQLRVKLEYKLALFDGARAELMDLYDNLHVGTTNWDDDYRFQIAIRFDNIETYKYYYHIEENEKVEYNVEKHFLYDKLYYTTYTKYLNNVEIYNNLRTEFQELYPNLKDDNKLLFTYISDHKREHSDADYVERCGHQYYHTWEVDPGNFDQEIMIHYNIVNRGNCTILCILITLGVTLILLVIGFVVTKIRRKKALKLIKKNN